MEFLLSRYRNVTVLLLVIIAQLLLLAYQVKSNQDVRLIRIWAVTAVTPMARLLEGMRRNTIGFFQDYLVLRDVREENIRLNNELGRLKMENQFLRTELETADRARALAAFQSRSPSRMIAARVIIGAGSGVNSKAVFVDRGSTSGVMKGMAVLTPDGIVGKVIAAYPTASQVLLITDPSFAAGVISQKHRVHGTVRGQAQGRTMCMVDFIPNEEKVEVGEMFYTSGADRIFPKGLPVGEVRVVREGRTFKEIYLAPSGFQGGLEEVLIVLEGVHLSIPDGPPPSSQDLHMLPPPPAERRPDELPGTELPALSTEADRLRLRYKKLGEAQGHTFGEGLPGSRPPDFNIRLTEPAQRPPTQPGAGATGSGSTESQPAAGTHTEAGTPPLQ